MKKLILSATALTFLASSVATAMPVTHEQPAVKGATLSQLVQYRGDDRRGDGYDFKRGDRLPRGLRNKRYVYYDWRESNLCTDSSPKLSSAQLLSIARWFCITMMSRPITRPGICTGAHMPRMAQTPGSTAAPAITNAIVVHSQARRTRPLCLPKIRCAASRACSDWAFAVSASPAFTG